MDLKRGIDKAVEAIVADLAKQAKVVGSDSEKNKSLLFLLITMKL
jgi:chaperonin GroEL